ncbi:hypothetical protein ERJ75_000106200 [Trypanosoma vivax]|nr:hypothetical protein ERJ75_000106200 [Trypanosoma vivax]
MLHTVARVLAGGAAVVRSRFAAPWSLKIRAWIDNIRIGGARHDMQKRSRVATQNVGQFGATLGESSFLSKKCGFIGIPFNRETGTVCLSHKTIRKPRVSPPLERLAVAELERLTPRMVRALVSAAAPCLRMFLSECGAAEALKSQRDTLAA